MSAKTATLSGVIPVLQTPFDRDGDIDVVALGQEVRWAAEQGVAGVATGMVSELLRLSDPERRALTEAVVEAAHDQGLTSVVGCGAESTVGAVRLVRHAEQAGADAVMVNAPLTVQLTSAELHRHFSAVANSTSLAVVIQDASGYIGHPVEPRVHADLCRVFGARLYVKPEADPLGPRLSTLRDLTDGQAQIIEGSGGGLLIDSFRRGIVATMPGTEVCWAVQELWTSLQTSDWPLAYRISGTLNSLLAIQTTIEMYVAVEKYLLVRQGVLPTSAAREPGAVRLDRETTAEIDRLLDQLLELRPGNPAGLARPESVPEAAGARE